MALYPTVLSFLTDLMVDIGALIQGQTPNNSEASFLFTALNNFIDELSADRLMQYTQTEASLQLAGKQTYQIGPGAADFPSYARPVRIDAAVEQLPGTTIHLPVKVWNYKEWIDQPERGRSGGRIDGIYCDYANPIANINVSPIPNNAPQLLISFRAVISPFVTLQDPWVMAPAYTQMIKKNLGVQVRSSFRSPLVDEVYIALAQSTREEVRRMNAENQLNSTAADLAGPVPQSGPPSVSPAPPPAQQQQ